MVVPQCTPIRPGWGGYPDGGYPSDLDGGYLNGGTPLQLTDGVLDKRQSVASYVHAGGVSCLNYDIAEKNFGF